MHQELIAARALQAQMHRAMRACAVDLEQVGARLEEALAKLRSKYLPDAAVPTTRSP